MVPRPVMLMILDGWGVKASEYGNAILAAKPENFNRLQAEYPHTLLEASGLEVGLPAGQMGNSEVGHLNMGAGRTVYQEITRISRAVDDGTFYDNVELNAAMDYALDNQGALHLMGLVSDGGVHSSMDHLAALLELARRRSIPEVLVHAFLDGRDVPPASALTYIQQLENYMEQAGCGRIASVMGRFYAMDRDKHWDRNEKAYRAMVEGEGRCFDSPREAIEASYQAGITDEFVEPAIIVDRQGSPLPRVRDGDAVIFFNFRADRARQITRAFVEHNFTGFTRTYRPETYFVCMTQYEYAIQASIAFRPHHLRNILGDVLANSGLHQLRIAETEKYAHVTFFFNGGTEAPNVNEDRILIPSPRITTYDLQPEMSAREVTDRVLKEISRDYYDVIILNYANPDMVGHTGVMEAAVSAVSTVDQCLQRVVEAVCQKGGVVLITADHGNAESMKDPDTGQPQTAHTTNPVPFIVVDDRARGKKLRADGSLRDIAPTLLEILEIEVPDDMTGSSLFTA